MRAAETYRWARRAKAKVLGVRMDEIKGFGWRRPPVIRTLDTEAKRSKYLPHQGDGEKARRVAKVGNSEGAGR